MRPRLRPHPPRARRHFGVTAGVYGAPVPNHTELAR